MLPSPAELEYFLEIANSLNLSRASERLGVSQPSLSLAIKRLEQNVGTTLLIRHKHGVSLTLAGKQLFLHARKLMEEWENTKSKALASKQKIQGNFTLGCNAAIANYLLSYIFPNLLENNPHLEISLKHDVSQKITEQVISMSIDIGIVINPIRHPDLIIHKLGADKTCFWISDGNRKIQNTHSDQAILIYTPDSIQAQYLILQCKKMKINFNRTITTSSLDVVTNLTAKGAGIGIFSERVSQESYPNILKKLPDMPTYSDELCLIYRNENREVKAIQTIIQAIKAFTH
jgi:DNA-binding transcriptional LysR family regulator